MTPGLASLPATGGRVNNTAVTLQRGDITAMEVDAFVFYCREDLDLGTGYGTGIQNRGGTAVKKALEEIGSVGVGKAVITTAGELKAGHIIHACGPRFQEADMENKLRSCMNSALDTAKKSGLKRVAFPPMGYGFYGVPMPLCIKVMTETIKQHCSNGTTLEEIRIVTVDKRDFNAFKEKIENI